MSFGTNGASRFLFGLLIGSSLTAACGSIAHVREYILDVPASMLRGPKEKDDKPLDFCKTSVCYVYEDREVRDIKKYISELEIRLKKCER